MSEITRREFALLAAGAGAVVSHLEFARPAYSAGSARVVIIGGGPGGAAVANRLKSADAALDVTLIEPKRQIYDLLLFQSLSRRLPLVQIDHARL